MPSELQGPPSEGRKALLSALLAGRLGLRPTEGRAGQEKSKVRTGTAAVLLLTPLLTGDTNKGKKACRFKTDE